MERFSDWVPRIRKGLAGLADKARGAHYRLARLAHRTALRRAPRRSGALQKTLTLKATKEGAVIEYPARYRALDEGGRVTGKPWLAIPVNRSVTVASPRFDGRLFFLRSKDGRAFLMARRGRSLEARWRLVRSTSIQGRRFVSGPVKRFEEDATKTLADLAVKETL